MVARVVAIVAVLGACHHHRDVNAPGNVDLELPPRNVADETMEYPGDPGERMLMLSPGVLAGVGGGSKPSRFVGDFAVEVAVNYGETESSHNDADARLFVPRRLLWPRRAVGAVLGWSALQIREPSGQDAEVALGPMYVELQRIWAPFGVGAGASVDLQTGDIDLQLNAFAAIGFVRVRVGLDGGVEAHLGYQLKIPTTWVWSR